MKKLIFPAFFFLIFALTLPVWAKNSEAGAQNTTSGQQGQPQTVSPSGNQVQNQNQIKTQNQGEETQIQTQNQEQENLGEEQEEGSENRSQKALENMSIVAQKVQDLLQIKTKGGIGDQVRQVAQEQHQAQLQIQQQIKKLDSKGQIAKVLFGANYGSVNTLKKQLDQNQLRIEQLKQLQTQLVNQADITMVSQTIQALIQENTFLQDRINTEEQTKSLFGWLFRLLTK